LRWWVTQQDSFSAFSHSFRLLERLLLERQVWSGMENDRLYTLHTDTLNLVCKSWYNCWTGKNLKDDDRIILTPTEMLAWVDRWTATDSRLRPDATTYTILIKAAMHKFSSDDDLTVAFFGESLLQRMLRAYPHEPHLCPTTFLFHKVMTSCVKQKDVEAAERLLKELERLYLSTGRNPAFQPTNDTYTIVLAGWAKRGAARQAEYVLKAIQEYSKQVDYELHPTRANFESCLNAWIKARSHHSGPRSEILLLKMDELAQQGLDTAPRLRDMGKILRCWVESRRKDGAERALAILGLMQEMDWRDDVKALVDGYVNVIRALSFTGDKSAPLKAERLIGELELQVGVANIPPKLFGEAYTWIITAWGRSGRKDAAERAQAVFDRLKERSSELNLSPDTNVYNALIYTWAKAGDGRRAEAVLKQMYEAYLAGNESAKPDTKSFNNVILAWSKSKDKRAAERAENVFRQIMEHSKKGDLDLKPDQTTYNVLLSALNGTQDVNTARRGEQYLRQLKELYAAGDRSCRPSAVTYTKAILLWSDVRASEAVERAQAILDEMHQLVEAGERGVRPTPVTYRAFMTVLDKSDLSKHRKEEICKSMKRIGRSGE